MQEKLLRKKQLKDIEKPTHVMSFAGENLFRPDLRDSSSGKKISESATFQQTTPPE
jgi:hypothetical protein